MRQWSERGDTIVEVAVAFSIFMLVTMGSMAIMNQGVSIAQRSLEQTQVQQVIDGQGDILRLVRQSISGASADPQAQATWAVIKTTATGTPSGQIITANQLSTSCPASSSLESEHAFFVAKDLKLVKIDSATGAYTPAQVTSRIDYSANKIQGIWIQAQRVSGAPSAYDMYIRACWNTVGTNVPMTMATIVRLYDN